MIETVLSGLAGPVAALIVERQLDRRGSPSLPKWVCVGAAAIAAGVAISLLGRAIGVIH